MSTQPMTLATWLQTFLAPGEYSKPVWHMRKVLKLARSKEGHVPSLSLILISRGRPHSNWPSKHSKPVWASARRPQRTLLAGKPCHRTLPSASVPTCKTFQDSKIPKQFQKKSWPSAFQACPQPPHSKWHSKPVAACSWRPSASSCLVRPSPETILSVSQLTSNAFQDSKIPRACRGVAWNG